MALTRIRAQQISDIDYKQAVRVIALSDIALSGGAPSTVDGVSLLLGDRILVAGQNTGNQNGLYDVSVLGTGANGTWVRTADGDVTGEIQSGMIVMVTEGDSYKDTQWKLTTNNPIVIGTTALAFEQNSAYAFGNIYANGTAVLANTVGGTVTFSAGDNIAITGNNTSKTVTIGVTGISLNSISNGTSNVNVVSSGGDVTIGVGGTSNVGVFSPTGLAIIGDLSVSGNATLSGNILGDKIVNGTTSIEIQTASGNANITVGGTSNVTVFTPAGQEITGSASATGNVTGGNILTTGEISATGNITGGNILGGANVNAITHTGTTVSVTGNVDAGNLITVGLVSATGNITAGNISATLLTGTLTTAAQPNVTSLGTLTNLNSGTISSSGNVTGANILTGGMVSAIGNVTGNYFIGNGALLSGIDTTLISNGTSNVKVLGSGGNVSVGVNGTSNIAVFNTDGIDVSGTLSATGNISGNRILGNGTQLTGINAFGNIAITGETTVSADSTSDTLRFAEGSGIAITTDAANNTITFSAAGTDSIFATGGDMGTVDEAVTSEDDLGTVDVSASVEYDLGTIVTSGLIYPDQLVLPIYTVSTLPTASVVASFIYVSDEAGGAVPAFSDGTNWRRVTDRAIVS